MGFEGTGIGTTRHALEHGGFNLKEAPLIEPTADRADRNGTAAKGFPGVRGNDQIEIALAIALLHIGQTMPLVRQGLQALTEHLPALHLDRQFTAIGAAQAARDTNQVTGIHQGGEVTEIVSEGGLLNEQLNRARFIRQGEEGELV